MAAAVVVAAGISMNLSLFKPGWRLLVVELYGEYFDTTQQSSKSVLIASVYDNVADLLLCTFLLFWGSKLIVIHADAELEPHNNFLCALVMFLLLIILFIFFMTMMVT